MQKILITFVRGLGLAPTRQTQKEQYAYPDVTSPNRLHSDPDAGNVFRGTRKKRKEAKEKKEYVYRYNIYIIISYIIYYILLYILILIFFCYFSFSLPKTFSQFGLMISV